MSAAEPRNEYEAQVLETYRALPPREQYAWFCAVWRIAHGAPARRRAGPTTRCSLSWASRPRRRARASRRAIGPRELLLLTKHPKSLGAERT